MLARETPSALAIWVGLSPLARRAVAAAVVALRVGAEPSRRLPLRICPQSWQSGPRIARHCRMRSTRRPAKASIMASAVGYAPSRGCANHRAIHARLA